GDHPIIPATVISTQGLAAIRFVLVGVALILLMAFRPQGIFGDRREVTLDAR
ncbi:MAG: ABC-type branched-chain amino acid transport system, permease component, partial [Actinomycetia bacterium]|nr:ABC-type branched-chain amino acid transport system, permease component [Actinomycetes bacterium]